jgi:hypothetical protein
MVPKNLFVGNSYPQPRLCCAVRRVKSAERGENSMLDGLSGNRNENYVKRLRTHKRHDVLERVNWKIYFKKAQHVYDRKWMRLRRIQSLRSKVYEVRRRLQESDNPS